MDEQKTKTEKIKIRVDADPDQSAVDIVDAQSFTSECTEEAKSIPSETSNSEKVSSSIQIPESELTNIDSAQITAAADKVFQSEIEFPELGDRFKVIEFIGAGGMGRVYKVHDHKLDKLFAVKLLRSELASDAQAVQRFRLECEAVSKLTHQNIVSVYDFHIAPSGIPFILMDFVEGLNLQLMLKAERALEPQRARKIMEQILDAVGHAHANGVIHRDLKPSNIIVKQNERGDDVAVVLDFGIAAVLEQAGLESRSVTRTGELVGSPQYMSPEQLNGEPVSKASDIFSLGCLFYEMLAGEPVFSENNPITVIYKRLKEPFPEAALSRLQSKFASIISACLETVPGDRYPSVQSLSNDLSEIAQGRRPQNVRALKTDYTNLFFKRVAAFFLDGFVIYIVAIIFGALISKDPNNSLYVQVLDGASRQFIFPFFIFAAKGTTTTISALCVALYYVLFEASRLRATPGKMMMNLVVATSRFEKLPAIVLSILRYASKVLLISALYFGTSIPTNSLGLKPVLGFGEDGILIFILLFTGLAWILRSLAQLPHDIVLGTRVVPAEMPEETVARIGVNSKRRLVTAAIATVLIPVIAIAILLGHAGLDQTYKWNAEIAKYTLQLQTSSNNPSLWHKRGQAYMYEGDYDRAVADFTRSIELSGKSTGFRVFADRGFSYSKLGQDIKAIADLLKATSLAPDINWPYVSLSHAENNLGMYREAKKHASIGIKLSSSGYSDLSWLYNNRAVAENGLSEYALAESDADRAKLLGGTHKAYCQNAGYALYGLKHYHASIELAREVLKTEPDNFMAYWLLGLATDKLNDPARALAYIDTAGQGEAAPGFKRRILESRGDVLLKLKRYDDAIKTYSMAIELGYSGLNGYEIFQSRAKAYEESGNIAKAISDRAEADRRKIAAASAE